MDVPHLLVQLVVALACAGAATVLIPRQIPGQLVGLFLVGFAGVWLGEWGFGLLYREYGLDHQLLRWQIQDVLIVPAIIGSAIVLYVVTAFLRWGRYS
ncbi:hypothetical protein IQ268_24905 [Oculatella sp. LEGE 06141]|uniref:hypothetical protein n=1 Tax=Oculatella sp. LEGE 06141 TaxID=1828648 RepID=UPI00187F4666|nr:hypothetical protein [Oculatella sp. LEGE 06141]MBE9181811.1 hypothetical protein [Oculatella sp. LEGE 06141]